jgi:hypothetical protein
MIINDLKVFRTGRTPAKAQAELIVCADAVLSRAAASQGLESVTRWRAQESWQITKV